ncbi:MAG: hypothetical protein SNH35_05895 [Rikenellaceae bacterium]
MNRAIGAAKSEYLILVDGDCILHPQYHLYHKEGWSDFTVNAAKMRDKQAENAYVCSNGLEKR